MTMIMIDDRPVYIDLTNVAQGPTGLKGEPGGNAMAVGNFADLPSLTIPAGHDLVQTNGFTDDGIGAALYVYDAAVNAAYVTANPYTSFRDAAGRGFRLIAPTGELHADQVGADAVGGADTSVRINAALAIADVRLRHNATHGVTRPIIVPSNRTLHMNGATVVALAGYLPTSGLNAIIGSLDGTVRPRVFGPGTVDAAKRFYSGATRINGFFFYKTKGFLAEGPFTVKNTTGYGCFAQDGTYTGQCSGTFRNISAENCQIHYEAMGVNGVLFENIKSANGDGDIFCQSFLHPLTGCQNVTFKDFIGEGVVASVVEIINNNGLVQRNLKFINCWGKTTSGGIGFVANGGTISPDVLIDNCYFGSTSYIGADISWATGRVNNSTIEGMSEGFRLTQSGLHWEFSNSKLITTNTGGAVVTGFAIAAGSSVRVDGGEIYTYAPAGGSPTNASNGGKVYISRHTKMTGGLIAGVQLPFHMLVADHQTTSTTGEIIGSNPANANPATFKCVAGNRYRIKLEASWGHTGTSNGFIAVLGSNGLAGYGSGVAQMGTSLTTLFHTRVTGILGPTNAASTAETAVTYGGWMPLIFNYTFVCQTSGDISLVFGSRNAADTTFLGGPILVEVDEY